MGERLGTASGAALAFQRAWCCGC